MGKLNITMIKGVLLLVIFIIILFTVLNDTAGDVGSAAGNLTEGINSSGECSLGYDCSAKATYPMLSFFKPKGIILLSVIAGIIIIVITSALAMKGK